MNTKRPTVMLSNGAALLAFVPNCFMLYILLYLPTTIRVDQQEQYRSSIFPIRSNSSTIVHLSRILND